ncbi:MAG TPA: aminoacyl-tRNA hydrolase [Ktedonobacterales bacterium]|nr:aminoacyl-tRNA hydrolase [Ktedonobacterales bacterium]
MKLIVGLGNPGLRYAHTRHNAGFDAVDIIARREGWSWGAHRGRTQVATGSVGAYGVRPAGGEKIVLAKPQTYMNDSGVAVAELVRFYKLAPPDLLVICDDLDLPLGKVRMRATGGAGGQHGMESILRHLGSNQFARIRVGVGRPLNGRDENVDFLLGRPGGDERIALESAIERAADAALMWVEQGAEAAMNAYNA